MVFLKGCQRSWLAAKCEDLLYKAPAAPKIPFSKPTAAGISAFGKCFVGAIRGAISSPTAGRSRASATSYPRNAAEEISNPSAFSVAAIASWAASYNAGSTTRLKPFITPLAEFPERASDSTTARGSTESGANSKPRPSIRPLKVECEAIFTWQPASLSPNPSATQGSTSPLDPTVRIVSRV